MQRILALIPVKEGFANFVPTVSKFSGSAQKISRSISSAPSKLYFALEDVLHF
jgi:hypothetical protein